MDKREIQDLLASWLILSVAFANLFGGLDFQSVGAALLTAGLGFLLHELAHKIVAEKFGLWAVFEANYSMLGFALLGSFAGFIFAAPGAVVTRGSRTGFQQKWISAAGPATNILLAVLFMFIPGFIGDYGLRINSWLALFNLIPFGGLDGESILKNDKLLFGLMLVVSIFLVFGL